MKKAILIVLLMAMVLNLCACNGGKTSTPTDSADPTPAPESKPLWAQGAYVDDFGDPTGDKYIVSKVAGTFSNSATADSDLSVEVLYDEVQHVGGEIFSFTFYFYEYNKATPALIGNSVQAKIKIGDTILEGGWSDREHDFIIAKYENKIVLRYGSGVTSFDATVSDPSIKRIYRALFDGETVQFVIKTGSYTTYKFSLSGQGFAKSSQSLPR